MHVGQVGNLPHMQTAPLLNRMTESGKARKPGFRLLRPHDLAWLVLFAALGIASPARTYEEFILLGLLAVFQVVEPRIAWLTTSTGALAAVATKLILAYLLIGVTGGVISSYYLILMVPVVAAATTLGAWGTLLVSLAASISYLSFLLYIDFDRYEIPPDQIRELCLRVLLFGVLALLMHQLASSSRAQARQHMEIASQLAIANRNLAKAEAVVRRSERLAAIGQLMAGLAHELRNPLGTMKASAEVLLKNIPAEQSIPRELAGYIREEVDRTNSLVTRFLDFAKPLELRRSPSDLNEIADRALDRIGRHDPPFATTWHRNFSPDVPALPLDAELMEHVFYNLLLNAAQASPGGTPITIKTRAVPGGVEASVIDRGSGIQPDQRENIFNPFFTTKPSGTGLGLAIVSKIVDEHGGTIAVESEPGHGSVFRIFLPSA